MRILLVTPLYPPDIAEPAPYVKELASRLKQTHEVTILAYNHIPEIIDGVHIISVEKQLPLLTRLVQYTRALSRASRKADIVYIQNGPSVELPMLLVAPFTRTPFVLRLGDETALNHATREFFHRILLWIAMTLSRTIVTHEATSLHAKTLTAHSRDQRKTANMERPLPRPEILPFSPRPTRELEDFEASWQTHVTELSSLFLT